MRMDRNEIPEDIEEIFKMCDAYWGHQGFSGEPHALLAGGRHSDRYFNVNTVLQFPNIRRHLASELERKLRSKAGLMDAIISSSYAAISIGQAVAEAFRVISVFTEKEEKDQVWTGRFELPTGAIVLQVEELITTLETAKKVRAAVLRDNPNPVKFVEKDGKTVVATIVHRPSILPIKYDSHTVIPLWEQEVHNWLPAECPLCKQGSIALKPKPNWQRFLKRQQGRRKQKNKK